jgi:HAE1 family hydrophobic/amphiphilic exporter-1
MSIIGTFAVMYELNYTVDNLSLTALTLSVGFVVDDAIVMLENIVCDMEIGKGAMEAGLSSSREIGFTIASMTLLLAAIGHKYRMPLSLGTIDPVLSAV